MRIEATMMLVCVVTLLATAVPGAGGEGVPMMPPPEEGHRGDLMKELEDARVGFEASLPDNL